MAGNNKFKKIATKTNTFKEIAENFDELVKHADRFLKFVFILLIRARVRRC